MKIFQFIGTRPELIKLAPIVWAGRKSSKVSISSYFTGQHIELVQKLASDFEINFELLSGQSLHGSSIPEKMAHIITRCASIIEKDTPDLVIVQGDTLSAFACAVAASYSQVPVAHVEAGLRSFDRTAPWPEENLRRQISQISDYHFAPTETSRENLLSEGVDAATIFVVGNSVIDAVTKILSCARDREISSHKKRGRFGILTMHRREMLLERSVSSIIERVLEVAERFSIDFIFPVHPSPLLKEQLSHSPSGGRIKMVEPIEYPEFIRMLADADIIITDSGGIQEEATYLRIPTICLRSVTERPEAVISGAVRLVGSQPDSLVEPTHDALSLDRSSIDNRVFGDGNSSQLILEHLLRILS